MLEQRRLHRRLEPGVAASDDDKIVTLLEARETGHLPEQSAEGFDASPSGPAGRDAKSALARR